MTDNIISDEDVHLTTRQAFAAARSFLHAYWERGGRKSDDLAILLGEMDALHDGGTADPAQWKDWLDAVNSVAGHQR